MCLSECKIFLRQSRKFLLEPSRAFSAEKNTSIERGFRYMIVLALVTSVITGIVFMVANNPMTGAWMLALNYVGILVAGIFFGLWLHLWAYLLGAKKGLEQTLKAVFYGYTPSYLFGWIAAIPASYFHLVSYLLTIWALLLTGMGLKRLHGITCEKAAISILIAILIPILILAAIVLSMGTLFISPLLI